MVERRCGEADENLAVGRLRIGNVLVPEDVRPAVLVDSDRLHGQNPLMTAAELARAAEELGIDVIGAAPAEAYDETEQHIRERRERGLFAGMKFTMAQPEVSCHPELLLDGEARTVVSAALCYWADAPDPVPGEGRLPRYAWIDHYALLRERLDALGRLLGGRYRVLVDENQHVDREGARRAGVGFYGKNTMMITREHGSWVVLGTLVTDVEIEATPPLDLDCGRCRLCIDACPTGRARRARRARREPLPLVLDAGPGSRAGALPGGAGASVYGCDICQDVCPWNRGIEKRRADRPLPADATPNVSLLDWLTRDGAELIDEVDRLYVPRNDPALAAAERAHRARQHRDRGRARRSPRSGRRATTRCSPTRPPGRSSGSGSGQDERRPERPRRGGARDPEPRCGARRDRGRLSRRGRALGRERLLELAEARSVSIERLLVEAPTVSLRAERIDVGRLARDAAETAALTSGYSVVCPDGGRARRRRATRERLRQALDNLIGNAIGHSPDGGEVTVTAARRGGSIAIEVADEGDGIPAADLERMFEPGVRLTTRPTGLGPRARRRARRSRGRTGERSRSSRRPGQGSTFRLVLPGASGAP